MKRSPANCLTALRRELVSLCSLDKKNQEQYSILIAAGKKPKLTKSQLHLLTESIFFAAFRAYEQFLRQIFIIYCLGKQTMHRRQIQSFLNPTNIDHAEALIQSAMPFLDWSSPDQVIERAELYLKGGYPIKRAIAANIDSLRDFKRIRNHIAHMSKESMGEYKKVLKKYFTVLPLRIPTPGEYLLLPSQSNTLRYNLLAYIDLIEKVSSQMT
jgi:hypothetical protein